MGEYTVMAEGVISVTMTTSAAQAMRQRLQAIGAAWHTNAGGRAVNAVAAAFTGIVNAEVSPDSGGLAAGGRWIEIVECDDGRCLADVDLHALADSLVTLAREGVALAEGSTFSEPGLAAMDVAEARCELAQLLSAAADMRLDSSSATDEDVSAAEQARAMASAAMDAKDKAVAEWRRLRVPYLRKLAVDANARYHDVVAEHGGMWINGDDVGCGVPPDGAAPHVLAAETVSGMDGRLPMQVEAAARAAVYAARSARAAVKA